RPTTWRSTMKMPVLRKNGASKQPKPALTTAAPAKPPSSACEDDVGSAHHHVNRSQTIAPISAAPTTVSDTTSASTPLAMLLATLVSNTKNAMKLKKAAHSTASIGV